MLEKAHSYLSCQLRILKSVMGCNLVSCALTSSKKRNGINRRIGTSKVGVYHFMHQGRRIFLIDTPGFDDTNRSDAEVLKDVAFWLAAAYKKKTTLAGILYLHRISDQKMQGSALRNLRMFQQLCGSNNLSSVVLATTHWTNLLTGDSIPEAQGREREGELMNTDKFWGAMVKRGSRVVRHDGTRPSALNIISSIIDRRQRVVLDIQTQLIDQRRNLDDTTAAQALQSELLEERRKGQERLAELKEDMKMAMAENDLKWQKQNEADQAEARAAIEKTHAETAALRTNLAKIAKEKDEQFRKMQEEMAAQANKFQAEIRKSNEALKAAQEESQRRAEAHERQRREDAEHARQQAEEHQRESAEREERIRQESNAAIAEQMRRDREDAENRYQQQRRDVEEAAAREQARWERQIEADRERTQMLIDQREETERKLREVQREQNKSKAPGFLLDAIKVFANVVSIGTAILGGPWLGIWV